MEKRPSPDQLLERCGFIRCQIEVSDFLIAREKVVYEKIKIEQAKLHLEAGLIKRQAIVKTLAELQGEVKALRGLWHYVSCLKCYEEGQADA